MKELYWRGGVPLLIALVTFLIPPPAGLTGQNWHLFGIFFAMIVGFITRPFPMGAVCIIGLCLISITKTLTPSEILVGFSSNAIWLIVMAFFFSRAFLKTGLGKRIAYTILAKIGNLIAWIFIPLGWGNWQATVASITGLVAKENIVGTLGILYGGGDGTVYQNIAAAFNGISGYSFLVFNLLCAPCFAAIGAIKREMNSQKWTWFAIGYQCGFAYLCGLMIYQFGCAFTGNLNVIGLICAILALAGIIYMLVRPYKEATTLKA